MDVGSSARVGRRQAAVLLRRVIPLLLLAVQIWWLHDSLVANHEVHAIRVPDTTSYLRLSRMSTVEGALTHYRTYGYPLLIKIFGWRELPRS